MLIDTQRPRPQSAVDDQCRRCRKITLKGGIAVCLTCRAEEEVARHIPPARGWFSRR
jgi:hypothetical protein